MLSFSDRPHLDTPEQLQGEKHMGMFDLIKNEQII